MFMGLAMPKQCCHDVTKLVLGCFVGGILRQETPNLNDPYHTKLLTVLLEYLNLLTDLYNLQIF